MKGILYLGAVAVIGGLMVSSSAQSLAIKNNNPGNLRFYGIGWHGEIGESKGFSVFDSMQNGVRAAYVNMRTKYYRDGVTTIDELINVWAPKHENEVGPYVDYEVGRVGIEAGERFDFELQGVEVLAAIFRYEAGQEIEVSDIMEGVAAA